jgi:hypothetical protein
MPKGSLLESPLDCSKLRPFCRLSLSHMYGLQAYDNYGDFKNPPKIYMYNKWVNPHDTSEKLKAILSII